MTEGAEEIIVVEEETEEEVKIPEASEKLLAIDGNKRVDADGDPNEDHPRFKKVYGRMKNGERKVEELTEIVETNATFMKEMQETNTALKESMERTATAQEAQTEATLNAQKQIEADKTKADESVAYNLLMNQRQEALSMSDFEAINVIDNQLIDMKVKQMAPTPATPVQAVETPTTPATPTERDSQITQFETDNSDWMYKDSAMTGAATAIENKLFNDPEWKKRPYTELLSEVRTQVFDRFNYTPENAPTASSVEGGGVISRKGGQVTMKLNANQLKAARGMNVTPAEYAKKLLEIREGK